MIHGVIVKPLRRIVDDRGYVMVILREDDEEFRGFGQAYVSVCFPGVVKAWHCHKKQWDYFCVVAGDAKVGLYDDREESPTRGETASVVIGQLNPALVVIPPQVWHGFTALGGQPAVLLNLPTLPYDEKEPDELRRPPFDPEIPFEWSTRGG
ncbi:MAG: dTDP-4-dehydrorhamnose 3,5-epimerase family protein [Armatimonadetes bacterium]|nr:dTDP-4-dehydrorhamnose 3,5-epimerase family protein [Armatimonadota bacterium]